MSEREEYIRGLRELADFLEANPDLPSPVFEETVNVFVYNRAEFADVARKMGKAEKRFDEYYAVLARKFGLISYEVNVARGQVCERKVVGTKMIPAREVEVVEWECNEPILAAVPDGD